MKRSEMVKKLEIPVSIIAGGMLTKKEIAETASNILNILEKNGMLPPETHIGSERLEGHIMQCQWEPE